MAVVRIWNKHDTADATVLIFDAQGNEERSKLVIAAGHVTYLDLSGGRRLEIPREHREKLDVEVHP